MLPKFALPSGLGAGSARGDAQHRIAMINSLEVSLSEKGAASMVGGSKKSGRAMSRV